MPPVSFSPMPHAHLDVDVAQILAFILSALIVGTFYHGQLTNYGLDDRVGCMFVIRCDDETAAALTCHVSQYG